MFGTPVFTRGMGEIVLTDDVYRGFTAQQEAAVKTWVGNLQKKHSKTLNDMLRVKGAIGSLKLPGNPADTGETNKRMALYNEGVEMAKHRIWEVMKAGQKMAKTGVTSSIGFNFYDLRGPVELLFPFYTPFRNMTPRPAPPNAGVGTAAHWQRITQPGYAYPGVPEAQRAQITTPNMVPCIATYKEFGKENQVTYTAEEARRKAREAELDPEELQRVSHGEVTSAELEAWRKTKAWGAPGKRMAEFLMNEALGERHARARSSQGAS